MFPRVLEHPFDAPKFLRSVDVVRRLRFYGLVVVSRN